MGATALAGFTTSLVASLVTSFVASLDLSLATSDADFDELQLADKNKVKTKSNNNFFMSLRYKLVNLVLNVQYLIKQQSKC